MGLLHVWAQKSSHIAYFYPTTLRFIRLPFGGILVKYNKILE